MLAYKVFSDTKARDREVLGERVTSWLRANPRALVQRSWVMQSSDNEFHCQSIVLQYDSPDEWPEEPEGAQPAPRRTRSRA